MNSSTYWRGFCGYGKQPIYLLFIRIGKRSAAKLFQRLYFTVKKDESKIGFAFFDNKAKSYL
jgi:hypothetical protein